MEVCAYMRREGDDMIPQTRVTLPDFAEVYFAGVPRTAIACLPEANVGTQPQTEMHMSCLGNLTHETLSPLTQVNEA